MSQRYDIVHIDFQANARGANAAIESMRQGAEKCKQQVKDLKEQLEKGKKANLPTADIQKLEDSLKAARKEFRQWDSAYNQLIKGMRTLDIAVKAFNDGSLAKMNAAFQKSAINAAKLQKTRLNPESQTYKKDSIELQALIDAAQRNLSSLNTVANQVIKTVQNGGKVSRNAVTEELQQQKELLFVLSETDKGYAQTQRRVAMLDHILKSLGGSYDYIRQNISDTNKVSDETLRKMYDELQQVNNAGKVTQQVMRGNATAMREIRKEQNRRVESVLGGDLGKQSEAEIRNAIANARELIQVYGTSSKKAQTLAAQIVNAESYLKTVGVEAVRAAKQQADAVQLAAGKYKMMQDRIKNIGALSQSALTETQKFWQAQKDGATVGSAAYKRAERALNAIAKQQRELTIAMSQRSASKLSRKNLSTLSESELRESVAAAKLLAASMKPTDKAYKDLIDNIIRAEEHIKSFGLEGQRSAHQAAEQMKVMNDRMLHLSTLSDGALEETRKFWQEQMNGAERGSKAYTEFETKMQEVVNRQQQLSVSQNKQTAATLPNYQNMGEAEIRRAIEAAREYQKTLKIDSDEYRNLSKNIVDAEAYVRKYGVEAQRSAQKDIEVQEKANAERQKAIQLMQDQLQNQGAGLSESALKAQHQYWQRLIDDPKTAASSLQDYKENLKEVENLQNQMMVTKGQNALAFFRGDTSDASADQIKQNADALKTYRDSLPRQTDAAIIQEINGYLAQAGQSASGAASQMMSLRDAFRIGLQGTANKFKGTPEQLRQAKQVLEETLVTTEKSSHRYEQLRRALDGIALEEKRVGDVTKEMQAVLDQPKGRSFNELKIAVEEGRKQLNSMSRTTKEAQKAYDELAAKVRAADLELKTLQNTEKGTTSSFEKAVSRLKTYITLYMGTAVAIQKLSTTVSDLMTLSDKMGEVRKTTGFTAEQVGRLSDNLTKLDTRTPIQNLMGLAATAGQLGLKTEEDIQGFTEAANMMLVALPEMGQEAATEMMKIALATGEVNKIQDQMNDGIIEGSSATAVAMEKIGSTIDRLRATTAASAPPIADFVKRVGAVGAQSGITVDQVAALGATVNSLGMGTEMAATVVSRMIPALKNHAFDLAQAIGVTPDTIRNLVDGGKGMEVILMILQHIKDQNLNADGIDKLLGIGGMGEIMKELDQRGARAGIVFAGLSQNVDELRKNLITANEAYVEGTAIQNEYNKMNDTTAAKWERLKNQMEEFFVNDSNQKIFGYLIDMLRVFANLITMDGPIGTALRWTVIYLALYKAKWTEAIGSAIMAAVRFATSLKASTVATKAQGIANTFTTTSTIALGNAQAAAAAKTNIFAAAWGKLNKVQKANVITAVAMAVVALGWALYDHSKKAKEAAKQLDVLSNAEKKAKDESVKQRAELKRLYDATQDQTKSLKERKKALHDMVGDATYNKYYKNISTESELVSAAAKAYHNLADKIMEAARARAIESEAQKLAEERIKLEDQKANREAWRKQNRGSYNRERTKFNQRTQYVGSTTGGATAGFSESQIATRGAAATKPLIVTQYENNESQISSIDKKIAQIDAQQARLKKRVNNVNIPLDSSEDNYTNSNNNGGGNGTSGTGGSASNNNPWGTDADAASTDWKKMNAKELVARRKQMNDFVKALQGDTDVKSVLAEDPALMKAISEKKVSEDADSVIRWYNTQRLKIQDVLHSRFLTNTGSWKDPEKKKQHTRSAAKMVKDDMSYYMDELDAYYTERKSKIEEAMSNGEITEAESWKRTLENEQAWRQRRAELQEMYAGKTEKVTADEQQKIYDILSLRTGDSSDMIKKTISSTYGFIKAVGEQDAAAMHKILGKLDKDIESDFLKMNKAVSKQVQAMVDIINKERPFNSLTENLQANLQKMDLLVPELNKKLKTIQDAVEPDKDAEAKMNDEIQQQTYRRLTFLLGKAENAYSMTWEKLEADMRKNGMGSWADAILGNENADTAKQAIIAQLHSIYDDVQNAIKQEASVMKKQTEIQWSDALLPNGMSIKDTYNRAISAIGIQSDSTSRANSLINAGTSSQRVADQLAIKQMQIQLNMQEHYYNIMRKIGQERIDDLERQKKEAELAGDKEKAARLAYDADHARASLNLATTEEQVALDKQRADIIARMEESENRLYSSLREWSSLLASSMQNLFEANNTGLGEYYDSLAKMRLTGEGSAGGTYVVIDNSGTENASAHYETLDGEEAMRRQLEIEQQNAVADAWKKVMDDINQKINDEITDWMNAALQNQAIDANTAAVNINTAAVNALSAQLGSNITQSGIGSDMSNLGSFGGESEEEGGVPFYLNPESGQVPSSDYQMTDGNGEPFKPDWQMSADELAEKGSNWAAYYDMKTQASNDSTQVVVSNAKKEALAVKTSSNQQQTSTQSMFAKMAQAANLYGIAYQTMSNDNLSTSQKFELFALQSAGQAAIAMLTTDLFKEQANQMVRMPGILGKLLGEMPYPAAMAVYAAVTALMGGLMALATSRVTKSKSQIAQVTGASAGAGRLSTGMLTYAEGNVNEFTDPSALTPGRSYNVDGADGRTYRAKYMGANPTTHITNGPEFHLVGERGREAIIDAQTTRQIQMDDTGIWHDIQTLYNGGSISAVRRRRGGVRAFASGNIDEFDDVVAVTDGSMPASGSGSDTTAALQASLDRNSEVLERALRDGIKGVFDVYGKGGLVDSYDRGKKQVNRHGEKY